MGGSHGGIWMFIHSWRWNRGLAVAQMIVWKPLMLNKLQAGSCRLAVIVKTKLRSSLGSALATGYITVAKDSMLDLPSTRLQYRCPLRSGLRALSQIHC